MRIRFEPSVMRIKERLSIASSYLRAFERSLPTIRKEAIGDLQAKAKAHSWDAGEYFGGFDILEHELDALPDLLGSAFIGYLHGTVEYGLTLVCAYLQEDKELPLKLNDLVGSPTQKAKTYITKLAGIEIGSDPSWSALTDLTSLRHDLLHSGGEAADTKGINGLLQRLQSKYPDQSSRLNLFCSGLGRYTYPCHCVRNCWLRWGNSLTGCSRMQGFLTNAIVHWEFPSRAHKHTMKQ